MRYTLLLAVLILTTQAQAQQKHEFKLGKEHFLLDGKPFQMISGEMHPARIPPEYWRHRIKMAKAMGCNTIAAYLFWNFHETKEGVFDFSSKERDIATFIRICQEEGMWVLIRPGPYVCAEWDFGGLPPYLLKIPDIKIRCMDPRYMKAVERYISRLSKLLLPLQVTNGGPVLMVQVENEYGSFGNDRAYMEALRDLWTKAGIKVPFYTADGPTAYMLEAGSLKGAAIGLDSGSGEGDFAQAKKQDSTVPVFSSETYPGWLTHWGEKWARPDTNDLKKEMKFLLDNNKSFNLYVIHGGTNFGYTAGANAFSPVAYQPDLTSYDYDAPITEQGAASAKYHMLRNLIAASLKKELPAIPAAIPTISIPAIQMTKSGSIWPLLQKPVKTAQPQPFENFGQDQGMAVYRTKLIGHKSGRLKIWEPHDYALVYLNGKFIDTVFRDGGNWEVILPSSKVKDPVLDIVVEGMGHINFAQFMIDRKGITDRVTLNGMTLMNWETFLLPMNEKMVQSTKWMSRTDDPTGCSMFEGSFDLSQTGDTFFDLSGYVKGMVYVNGHLLGRYWKIGPQQRLYCPATWLKKGRNQIRVFDLLQDDPSPVTAFTNDGAQ